MSLPWGDEGRDKHEDAYGQQHYFRIQPPQGCTWSNGDRDKTVIIDATSNSNYG